MSSERLSPERRRFIDEMAALLVPWSLPQIAGRIYGYLLTCPDPVSLDQIAEDLDLSKSSASVTTRLLEQHGMAVRYSVPGTKRILYGQMQDPAALLAEKCNLLAGMAKQYRSYATTLRAGPMKKRMMELAHFHQTMKEVIEAGLENLDVQLAASGRQTVKD